MQRLYYIMCSLILVMSMCGCTKDNARLVQDTSSVDATYSYTEMDVEEATDSDASTDNKVAVYVCGAVSVPGVYYMSPDSIKEEALLMAGGFAQGAATTYVNLAEKVRDGEKIYFPYEEELGEGYSPISGVTSDGKININTATVEELMTLPGIGESKAESIVEYREKYGAFQSIEQITQIPGIKEGVYNNIKDNICVN